jgi:hypothetical protein
MDRRLAQFLARGALPLSAHSLRQSHLILHIGFLKTGSTYLQQQIGTARKDLEKGGLLFPATGIGIGVAAGPRAGKTSGHSEFAQMIGQQDWTRMLYLPPLLAHEACQKACRRILISAENISYHHRPDRNPLLRRFLAGFGSVEVVIYLRRWDDWIESLYKERLDFGETRSFEAFRGAETWQTDYTTRLDSWERTIGPNARLRVFDYDAARRAEGGLLAQFFRDVLPGIPAPISRTAPRANPSYNATQAEALRAFNLGPLKEAPRRTEVLDSFLAGPFAALEGPRQLLTPAERAAYLDSFLPQNAALQQRFGIDLLSPG